MAASHLAQQQRQQQRQQQQRHVGWPGPDPEAAAWNRKRRPMEMGKLPQPPKQTMQRAQLQDRQLFSAGCCEDAALWTDKPTYLRPTSAEVVAAVESLYADKLKPFGRILLKRVRELNAAALTKAARAAGRENATIDPDSVPLIDPKCLRKVCETCDALRVEPEDGKEYSVILVGRPHVFVDVCSPFDCYPPELWEQAANYFEGLQGDEMLLPGGRYACAQVLMTRELPFLAGRSLGEVCHIVQLAVSQRRILGYLEGSMVPFGRSVDWIKEQCAVWQQPVSFAKKAAPDMPLATWQQARACLWEILEGAASPGQPGVITLSNVKRLFRSRFNLELSETALGHSRLNELLQDPRFSDICTMELQGKSQVVVQRLPTHRLPAHLTEGAHIASCQEMWQAVPWPAAFLSDDHALAPWGAAEDAAAACAGGGYHYSGAAPPMQPAHEVDHASAAGCSALSSYVQQLLELDTSKGREALVALSTYATARTEAKPTPAGHSRRSSMSTSRSTSDGSAGQRSDDGGDCDESDLEGLDSALNCRLAACGTGYGHSSAKSFLGCPVAPPPGLGGLAPPPGLGR